MPALPYLPLFAAWIVLVVTPGPEVLVVLRFSASGSRRSGLLAGAGAITGQACWLIAVLAGVTAVLDRYQNVYLAVRLIGALLLIGYGLTTVRSAWRRGPKPTQGTTQPTDDRLAPTTDWRCWRAGLLCDLCNPKALMFFGALFASLLPQHITIEDQAGVLVGMLAVAYGWFAVVATLASVPDATKAYARASKVIDTVTGGLFAAMGGRLVLR
jgi:threonine efflux protein